MDLQRETMCMILKQSPEKRRPAIIEAKDDAVAHSAAPARSGAQVAMSAPRRPNLSARAPPTTLPPVAPIRTLRTSMWDPRSHSVARRARFQHPPFCSGFSPRNNETRLCSISSESKRACNCVQRPVHDTKVISEAESPHRCNNDTSHDSRRLAGCIATCIDDQ